jgi:hypothetical protein
MAKRNNEKKEKNENGLTSYSQSIDKIVYDMGNPGIAVQDIITLKYLTI